MTAMISATSAMVRVLTGALLIPWTLLGGAHVDIGVRRRRDSSCIVRTETGAGAAGGAPFSAA